MSDLPSTILSRLTLRDYRLFPSIGLEPDTGLNIVHGPNGSGKSSLLEAIYLLGTFSSFRMARSEDLIRRGAGESQVSGEFLMHDAPPLEVRIVLDASGRKVKAGGKAPNPDHFNRLPMVLFHPGHLDLVYGSPEGRRRFLDRILVQTDTGYQRLLRDFHRVWRSRNRLLKERGEREVLSSYEERLARAGVEIMRKRSEIVERLGPFLSGSFRRITSVEECGVEYRPDVPLSSSVEELARIYRDSRDRDILFGATSRGPHRDEVAFALEREKARGFASHGQVRAIVLALKMAEVSLLKDLLGRRPVLLLDDVSSELDEERNLRMMEFVRSHGGQVFITTTKGDDAWAGLRGSWWKMEHGILSEVRR